MPRQSHSMLPFVPSLNKLWARRFLMTSQAQRTQPALRWQMPILPDHYDRSTLSPEEWLALEHYTTIRAESRRGQALQKQLARFNHPLTDLYLLLHQSFQGQRRVNVHRFMQR